MMLCIGRTSIAQSIRIEPPNWWIGMKNQKLQLLLKGDKISNEKLSIKKPGVQLIRINKTDSPDYLFVDLTIDAHVTAGNIDIKIGHQKIEYPLLKRVAQSDNRHGFDSGDAMYLIMSDRFANGDQTNDHLPNTNEQCNRQNPGGRHGGDIQGVIDHLDYIRDMGYTTLWCTPFLENNLPSYSYHGYAISDYYKIDPRYGTNALYKKLSAEAGKRGIKLIMDMVPNHCGSGHWWIKEPPFKDWINNKGQYISTNHHREALHDPHGSHYDAELMSSGWFVPTMPDLNQRNPFMATYLIQNAIWWIEYADLSGLRIDTYPYIDKTFSSNYTKAILEEYPHINITGEEWSVNPIITSYWQKGMMNKDGYRSYLPTPMDFPGQQALIQALNQDENDFNGGWAKIYQNLANDDIYANPNNLLVIADNHDMSRVYTQLKHNKNAWHKAMLYLSTVRGIPQYFYGDEILMSNPEPKDDGTLRSDMPGGWMGDAKNAFTGNGLSPEERDAQSFLKKLLNIRKNAKALQYGKLIHFAPENGIYIYFRIFGNEKYMIAMSKNPKNVLLDKNKYSEVIRDASLFYDVLNDTAKNELTIEANGYLLLKIS